MSRPGITYDDVANAAQQLAAQGKNPTIETIRFLTGTGSSSTIAQHLRAWKNRQAQASAFSSAGKVPEELMMTVKGIWEQLLIEADEKVAKIKQELDQTIIALEEQNKKLKEDNTRWQQQFHQMKQEKEGLASDKTALEQMIRKFENEKTALIVENDGKKKQLQDNQERVDELHRLNKQVQSNLEHYHEASREQRMLDQQRHEQAQTQLAQTINQLKQDLTSSNQQRNSLQQELEQLRYGKTFLQDQHDQLTVLHEAIKPRLDQAEKEILQHATGEQHWQNQYQKTQEKLNEQHTLIINLQSQLAVLKQKYSDIQSELNEVSEQNKFLTNERWVLGQENAQLLGQLKQFEKFGLYQLRAEQE